MYVLNYMYRDADNYKQHGEVTLSRALTEQETERIRRALDMGEYFIPQQVGMPPLQMNFGGIDPDSDHAWHELGDVSEAYGPNTRNHGGEYDTDELIAAFEQAAQDGWDDTKYDPVNRINPDWR
jgi:hypothetical protein